jgi:hypothetical protein
LFGDIKWNLIIIAYQKSLVQGRLRCEGVHIEKSPW